MNVGMCVCGESVYVGVCVCMWGMCVFMCEE